MATTTYDRKFHKAFALDENFFKRLSNLVAHQNIEGSYKVFLSNDSTIDNLTLDELLALPNSRHRRITKLSFDSTYRSPTRLRLRFESKFGDTPCDYEVIGNDKDATYVATELDRLLADVRRRFSYLSAMPWTHQGVWYWLITIVALGFNALLIISKETSLIPTTIGIVLVLTQFMLTSAYGRLIGWLAPPVYFLIGDGIQRAQDIRSRQRTFFSLIFVAGLIGVAVSIGSNWLYDHYFK